MASVSKNTRSNGILPPETQPDTHIGKVGKPAKACHRQPTRTSIITTIAVGAMLCIGALFNSSFNVQTPGKPPFTASNCTAVAARAIAPAATTLDAFRMEPSCLTADVSGSLPAQAGSMLIKPRHNDHKALFKSPLSLLPPIKWAAALPERFTINFPPAVPLLAAVESGLAADETAAPIGHEDVFFDAAACECEQRISNQTHGSVEELPPLPANQSINVCDGENISLLGITDSFYPFTAKYLKNVAATAANAGGFLAKGLGNIACKVAIVSGQAIGAGCKGLVGSAKQVLENGVCNAARTCSVLSRAGHAVVGGMGNVASKAVCAVVKGLRQAPHDFVGEMRKAARLGRVLCSAASCAAEVGRTTAHIAGMCLSPLGIAVAIAGKGMQETSGLVSLVVGNSTVCDIFDAAGRGVLISGALVNAVGDALGEV